MSMSMLIDHESECMEYNHVLLVLFVTLKAVFRSNGALLKHIKLSHFKNIKIVKRFYSLFILMMKKEFFGEQSLKILFCIAGMYTMELTINLVIKLS